MEEFLTLRDLFNKELSISEIARQTGHSRVTVRKYLNSQVPPLPQKRSRKPRKLDGHREYIIDRLKECPLSQELLYDNITQIVKKRSPKSSDSTWNSHYQDFFEHYGFIPRLCRPYRPQTKGKIERTVEFVKKDFFMGGRFTSFTDLNSQLQKWLSRVILMQKMLRRQAPSINASFEA
ncbi:Integrase core domain protein [uncultured archaeon]|nr:Integrase core domain protein [uncultured archaeon]